MNNKPEQTPASSDLITKVGVALSLFSVLALGVSYLNHLMFYSFFGIPINNYIQIGESVVLFLPQLVTYVINAILLFSIWGILVYIMTPIYKTTEGTKSIRSIKAKINRYGTFHDHFELLSMIRDMKLSLILLKRSFLKIRIRKFFRLLSRLSIVLINFVARLFIFLLGPALMLSPYANNVDQTSESKEGIGTITSLFMFSVVSFDMIFDYGNYLILKIKNENTLIIFKAFKIIFYTFLLVYIQSFVSAANIKAGLAEYDIEFMYNNAKIRTDTSLVYIGATQNYVFLRDRHSKKNMIFKSDKIESYSIKKIEYEYKWFWEN